MVRVAERFGEGACANALKRPGINEELLHSAKNPVCIEHVSGD
jgi:hypothetical protein